MLVVAGSASRLLAARLAKTTGARLASVETRRFPDGECYVRIAEQLAGQEVAVVQTTAPDANLVEHLLLLDAVRDAGARRTISIAPYFGYARQDKRFQAGEAVSARVMATAIGRMAEAFLTVDVHAESVLEHFSIPAKNVDPMLALAAELKRIGVDLVLAPDKGALIRAQAAAKAIGCDWDHLEKTRVDSQTVTMRPKALAVQDLRVAIVDDIVSTGGTMLTAAKALRTQGARWVGAVCTHGLFVGDALARLKEACNLVLASDTIEGQASKVSVAGPVAEALRGMLS